jgi:hypothetical protein
LYDQIDGNETSLCLKVIHMTAVLPLQKPSKVDFLKLIKFENITATESKFLPNAPTKRDILTPGSRRTPNPPDPTTGTVMASHSFLGTRVAT